MIGRTISHYEITEKLGEGGMGVVYKARDNRLKRFVALKVLPPDSIADADRKRRFINEARSASALNHPNIVTVHDVDHCDGIDFIAMEFVEGQTLDKVIGSEGLKLNNALKYAVQIADALAKAHSEGIIHRDLKPANVMVTTDGRAKILDFGLAKLTEADPVGPEDSTCTQQQLTQTGKIMGTAGYMSPEQVEGGTVDARSDIFSFGSMLYEMLTGRRAFKRSSLSQTLTAVLHMDPPPLGPLIPHDLRRVVERCLQKDPGRRFQTMADLKVALQELKEESESGKIPGNAGVKRGSVADYIRKRRVGVSIALAGAAVALILLTGVLSQRAAHQPTAEALRWYREGVTALRDGTYYKAGLLLQRATVADPQFLLAHARLAEAWNELDYSDRAREAMLHAAPPGVAAPRLSDSEALELQAIHAVVTRDRARAVAQYRALLSKVSEAESATVLVDLGRALEAADDPNGALESFGEAARRRPDLAAAPLRLGALLRRQRRYVEAEKALVQAESLYRALSNMEGVTHARWQRGVLLNQAGRLSEARTMLEQALSLAQVAENPYQRIVILIQLSSVDYTEGKAEDAARRAAEALDLARKNGFEDLTARAMLEMGGNAHVRGELKAAEADYLQALESTRRFKGRWTEMRALVSLASVRLSLGKSTEAVPDLETALAWYDHNGYRKEAGTARILLARAKRFGGDYTGSAAALEQQAAEAQRAGDDDLLALSLSELGSTWIEQERFTDALGKFRAAYDLSAARGNNLRKRWEAAHIADALWRIGHFAEAGKAVEEAEQLASAGKDKALLAWIHRIRGEIALSQGRFAEAAALAKRAEAAEEDKTEAADALRVAALAELGSGRREKAQALMKRAATLSGETETPRRLVDRLLATAALLTETGDRAGAVDAARRASEIAARSGQRVSEWQARSLIARVTGDRTAATESAAALDRLWAALGPESTAFSSRPDIKRVLKAIGNTSHN